MNLRSTAAPEERRAFYAGLLVRRGWVLVAASVLAITPMITGFPQAYSAPRPHPVKGHAHEVAFVKSSVAAARTARDATRSLARTPGAADPITTARALAVTPAQDVAGAVTVVGVTWPKSTTAARDSYQIRTLRGAAWSQWQTLGVVEGGPDSAEAAGTATSGTSPYVITGASKFEVRSLTTDTAVSTAAAVQVVDPGTSSADDVTPAPGAAAAATVRPAISTRAEWGADESLRLGKTPIYGQVQLGFVHHTADLSDSSANTYTEADVPAMIRGMYAYHVKTLGWDDIGYNFLIDRFGRTWEGRYGGTDQAVVGAQTLGYNAVSTGVAAIGNFEIDPTALPAVPPAVIDAFSRLLAWKFSLAGIPATGNSPVLGLDGLTPLQRISGHKDAYATLCPGRYLYAMLPQIRAGAAALLVVPPIAVPPNAADFTGDGLSDIHGIKANGDMLLYRGNGVGGFSGPGVKIGLGWGMFAKVFSPGDYTGDGKADLLAIKANGDLFLYRGNGVGGFSGPGVKIGLGWGMFAKVFSPGDYTGDGKADLLAIKANGDLFLYRGNGVGGFSGPGVKIGLGWGMFAKVF
jgi:hypothetical protein